MHGMTKTPATVRQPAQTICKRADSPDIGVAPSAVDHGGLQQGQCDSAFPASPVKNLLLLDQAFDQLALLWIAGPCLELGAGRADRNDAAEPRAVVKLLNGVDQGPGTDQNVRFESGGAMVQVLLHPEHMGFGLIGGLAGDRCDMHPLPGKPVDQSLAAGRGRAQQKNRWTGTVLDHRLIAAARLRAGQTRSARQWQSPTAVVTTRAT